MENKVIAYRLESFNIHSPSSGKELQRAGTTTGQLLQFPTQVMVQVMQQRLLPSLEKEILDSEKKDTLRYNCNHLLDTGVFQHISERD